MTYYQGQIEKVLQDSAGLPDEYSNLFTISISNANGLHTNNLTLTRKEIEQIKALLTRE